LDAIGKKVGVEKIEFRKHLPADIRFKDFAADMVYYNIWDSKVNTRAYLDYLLPEKEKDNWNWEDALYLEKMVAYIVTMASHRGFDFDTELAKENLKELDQMMAEIEAKILPVLPKKPITKTAAKDYTLNASQFLKKDGSLSAALRKFVAKHGGEFNIDETKVKMFGKEWTLPLPKGEPLVTEVTMELKDTTHIKEWLVSLGWVPLEFKDRDISIRQHKGIKIKRNEEEFATAVKKYVEETKASNFCKYRCEHLKTTIDQLEHVLLKRGPGRS